MRRDVPGLLRVAVITESLDVWGAEESLLELLQHAEINNVQATVFVSPGSPLVGRLTPLKNVTSVEHKFARHPAKDRHGGLGGAGLGLIFAEGVSILSGAARLLRPFKKFDLVVSFSMWQSLEASLAAKILRKPSIFDFHETFVSSVGRKMLRVVIASHTATIAPSKALFDFFNVPTSRTRHVIPRPIPKVAPLRQVDRFGHAEGSVLTVGIFGQIAPHKRIHIFLDALEAISDSSGLQALIVGGKPSGMREKYEEDIRARVESFGDGATVVDRVSSVSGLMSQCDIVLNISEHEAFGRTVVEAAVSGSVPLVLKGTAPEEVVRRLNYGITIDGPEALSRVLEAQLSIARQNSGYTTPAFNPSVLDQFDPTVVSKSYFGTLRKHCLIAT